MSLPTEQSNVFPFAYQTIPPVVERAQTSYNDTFPQQIGEVDEQEQRREDQGKDGVLLLNSNYSLTIQERLPH